MWVEALETKGQGGTKKPTFNMHTIGTHIDNSNAWSNIRTYLAGRSYYNSKFGQGQNVITPNHCRLCYGIDHPRGMCPFPDLDGWMGPVEMDIIPQRTDRYSHNLGQFPPGMRY